MDQLNETKLPPSVSGEGLSLQEIKDLVRKNIPVKPINDEQRLAAMEEIHEIFQDDLNKMKELKQKVRKKLNSEKDLSQ